MIHLDPRFTDSEILRACRGQESGTVGILARRLADRNVEAAAVRQNLESIKPLLKAGSLAECLAEIDRCRADLNWMFTAPGQAPTTKGE
jgi:hypothetical protein